ncbi:hypothetical protein [Tsukamurella pseudospumae]|uniref:hypothetical protein n=1 Tax=Tsukamurella pseudospumae TaxID=239498 RepID=UPI000A403581|nr:hypothetical protein [Tsukamurella pseudospumae]
MTESDDGVPALPAWVEAVFADERAYWTSLRDGGVVTVEGLEMVQREWGAEQWARPCC